MKELFIGVLGMSLMGGIVGLAVMFMRLPLRKAPKVFSYAMWAVVLFRLLCPISFESPLGVMPAHQEALPAALSTGQMAAPPGNTSPMGDGVIAGNAGINDAMPPVYSANGGSPAEEWIEIAAWIWFAGMIALLVHAVFGYLRLKRCLAEATLLSDNIFESDRITGPFVLGFWKPRIYLPTELCGAKLDYILKHEETHIRRGDHLVKPVAYLALCLHWFNPVVWLSYLLMSRDLEMSCDESVLKNHTADIRSGYSGSLMSVSLRQSGLSAPLAFGESNIKARVENVLRYKKPQLWISVVAIVLIVIVSVAFAMNRPGPAAEESLAEQLLSYRTEYVGHNSKVGGLAGALDYPDRVTYDSIELFTDAPPYAVTVKLNTDTETKDLYTRASQEYLFKKNAILMFALIHNVELVNFELNDGVSPYSMQFTREMADDFAGGEVWAHSDSSARMEALLQETEAMEQYFRMADVFSADFDTVKVTLHSDTSTLKSGETFETADPQIVAYMENVLANGITHASETGDLRSSNFTHYQIEMYDDVGGYSAGLYYDARNDKAYVVKDGGAHTINTEFAAYVDSLLGE